MPAPCFGFARGAAGGERAIWGERSGASGSGAGTRARGWEREAGAGDLPRRAGSSGGGEPAFADGPNRSINNVLGSRLTLLLGTTGYALYIGSYLSVAVLAQSGLPLTLAQGVQHPRK